MMTFGFSGSQSYRRSATREIITRSNWLRAETLADFVATHQVVIRRVVRDQVYTFPNPAFEGTIRNGFTYPRDWIATLQALLKLLRSDGSLMASAEVQGVTTEGIDEMIERIREMDTRKERGRHVC